MSNRELFFKAQHELTPAQSGTAEDLLNDLYEYFEDKADADFDGEDFVPNEEMKFLNKIEHFQRVLLNAR